MSTSRPTTPVAASDTSSDGGSLSDLDSGWTDLETNRSNGRHSPTTTSEAGDSEDARSAIDRYDREAWEGLTPERDEQNGHDIEDDTFHVESSSATGRSQPPSSALELSELTLEDWVADAVGSSLLSDDETSTPHMSFHTSSSPLRLSFPDPLSNSDHDLLPSHSLSRTQSQSTEGSHEVRGHSPARTGSLSSVTARSASATTPSDTSFSIPDEDAERQHDHTNGELPSVELDRPAVSYALSIILLGHPPLPHLKRSTLITIIDMVATVLSGSPQILEWSDTARIHEVPIYARQPKSADGSAATSTHRIIIEDRTSGMSPSSSFTTLHCPTLALIFIQPPLSSPSLPSLPWNTRYLPLLLPSISDGFASSLLDLSPSVLFEHSVPDMPSPDNAAMKSFALQQCNEMDINENRLDGSKEILTVNEFSDLPTDKISSALRDVMYPPKEATKETSGLSSIPSGVPSGITTFRKQIVFISAFLIALLFGSTVFFRGSSSATSNSEHPITSSSQEQKAWSFLHPFVNRTPKTQDFPADPPPPELSSTPPRSLMPASLKSLAVSVFRPDSTEMKVASTSTGSHSRPEKGKGKVKQVPGTRVIDSRREVRPATIEPAAPHLTIDAPYSKSLSVLPQAQFPSSAKGKGKDKSRDIIPDAHNPFPSSTTSLSTRISNALAPLFDRVQTDIRELQEAIDALLQSLLQLQRQTSHGIGELIHVLSEHWQPGQGVQELANKMHRVAQTVGEKASERHARARYNARKVRDVTERYVSAARQQLKRGVENARGNARTLKDGMAFRRPQKRNSREHRKVKKARAACKRQGRCLEYTFESVWALVA